MTLRLLVLHSELSRYYKPGTGTSMKNGYSIVSLKIEKDPFSKVIFGNFTPFLPENKEKSELKFTPFFSKTRIFSEILHPFREKTRRNQGLNLPHVRCYLFERYDALP